MTSDDTRRNFSTAIHCVDNVRQKSVKNTKIYDYFKPVKKMSFCIYDSKPLYGKDRVDVAYDRFIASRTNSNLSSAFTQSFPFPLFNNLKDNFNIKKYDKSEKFDKFEKFHDKKYDKKCEKIDKKIEKIKNFDKNCNFLNKIEKIEKIDQKLLKETKNILNSSKCSKIIQKATKNDIKQKNKNDQKASKIDQKRSKIDEKTPKIDEKTPNLIQKSLISEISEQKSSSDSFEIDFSTPKKLPKNRLNQKSSSTTQLSLPKERFLNYHTFHTPKKYKTTKKYIEKQKNHNKKDKNSKNSKNKKKDIKNTKKEPKKQKKSKLFQLKIDDNHYSFLSPQPQNLAENNHFDNKKSIFSTENLTKNSHFHTENLTKKFENFTKHPIFPPINSENLTKESFYQSKNSIFPLKKLEKSPKNSHFLTKNTENLTKKSENLTNFPKNPKKSQYSENHPKNSKYFKFFSKKFPLIKSPFLKSPLEKPFSTISPSLCRALFCDQSLPRQVQNTPYRTLDAPGLSDNFYCSLLGWSTKGEIAVALQRAVYVYAVASQETAALFEQTADESDVTALAWSDGGSRLAVGYGDGLLQLWDMAERRLLRSLRRHRSRVGSLDWKGGVLACGSKDRLVSVIDVRSGDEAVRLAHHKQEVCGVRWSRFGRYSLASGGNDNSLLVWDVGMRSPVKEYKEHVAAVKAIDWSPHKPGLLVSGGGSNDNSIRFWDTQTSGMKSQRKIKSASQVCNIAWSPNVDEFVSTHGYSENFIKVYEYGENITRIAKFSGHKGRVLYLSMSPDGTSIVTGSGDETLKFWNIFPKANEPMMKKIFKKNNFTDLPVLR